MTDIVEGLLNRISRGNAGFIATARITLHKDTHGNYCLSADHSNLAASKSFQIAHSIEQLDKLPPPPGYATKPALAPIGRPMLSGLAIGLLATLSLMWQPNCGFEPFCGRRVFLA